MSGRLEWGGTATEGAALIDLLLAAAICVSLAGVAVPLSVRAADSVRARSAASFVAGRLRLARMQAVAGHRATALVFSQNREGWVFRRCQDGNGNGVRLAETADGRDPCVPSMEDVAHQFAGVQLALVADVPDLDGQAGNRAAVRFGVNGIASCTPVGNCTPGSVYLRSAQGEQFAVRVTGTTGRARVLRFDRGQHRWTSD